MNCCHSILNSSSAFCWVCVRFKFTLMNWKGANSSVLNFVQPWSRPKLRKKIINHNLSQDRKVTLIPKLQHLALSELSRGHCKLPASGSDTGWIYAVEVLTMTAASSRGQLRSCLDCRASLELLCSSSFSGPFPLMRSLCCVLLFSCWDARHPASPSLSQFDSWWDLIWNVGEFELSTIYIMTSFLFSFHCSLPTASPRMHFLSLFLPLHTFHLPHAGIWSLTPKQLISVFLIEKLGFHSLFVWQCL